MDKNNEQTGSVKYDCGKPRIDLIPPHALIEVAKTFTFGANKYSDHNYLGGLKVTRTTAAALRHIFAFLAGSDADEETGLHPLAHAICELLMTLENCEKYTEATDDRIDWDTYGDKQNGK